MATGRRFVLGGCVAIAVLWAPSPAHAEQRLITIDTPSRHVDPTRVRLNGTEPGGRLRANVLLPDGYDGRRRFPVLFLLHGVGDNFSTWFKPSKGDLLNTAKGLRAIIVMPEAGRGFHTNWWNDGRRADPGWQRFFIDELIPQVERELRVLPGRSNHAIAGASMGGFGAAWLGSQLPGYFGSIASFSGFVQHQRPEVEAGLRYAGQVEYRDIFGPMDGFYATGHNPTRLVTNLLSSRVYVTVGDGTAEPGVQSAPLTLLGGGALESWLRPEADEFVAAARAAGVDTTYRPLTGVHDWPYWRRHLRDAIEWGLFRPVPEAPDAWTYRTVAQTGEAWGLRYRFAAPPEEVVTLARAGDRIRGAGSGTVTLLNTAGCGFTAALPFERGTPPRVCGRLSVRVRPRRVRLGRVTRVRFRVRRVADGRRVAMPGARVRLGRETAGTNRRGRAVLRYRPSGRPGVRRARVTARGLRAVRPRVRVVRP